MRDITTVPQDYIATYTKTDTVMKKFDDGCEVYEVIEDRKPLVRCKDCIFYEKALSVQGFCHNHESIVYVNDFCSYGALREDDEA